MLFAKLPHRDPNEFDTVFSDQPGVDPVALVDDLAAGFFSLLIERNLDPFASFA